MGLKEMEEKIDRVNERMVGRPTLCFTQHEVRTILDRVKELETEARQRHKLAARFAGRKISQPSADSDIMAANDIKELEGTQWGRIANDLTEAKSENAKLLAQVGELEEVLSRIEKGGIMTCCEKCWADAYRRMLCSGKTQSQCYSELLRERDESPCSPKEQAGEYWDENLQSDRRDK